MKALGRLRLILNNFFDKVAIKPVKDGLSSLTGFYLFIHEISCEFSPQQTPA